MSDSDFRPRIDSKIHRRLRLYYFDRDPDYSNIYENMATLFFNEEGEQMLWYSRIETLADNENMSELEALNKVVQSVLTEEGKFKPGAKQIYERNDSIGE